MISKYPKSSQIDNNIIAEFELIIEAIISIRRAKATIDQGNAKIAKAFIKLNSNLDISSYLSFIKLLAKCQDVEITKDIISNSARDVSENLESFVPLAGVDTTAIIARLNSQKTKLEKEIAKLENMLNNEKFIANAPQNVLETNRQGLAAAKDKLAKVTNELGNLT